MKISKIVILIVVLCFLSLDLFAQVTQEWVVRYNGPGNNFEDVSSMAVDDSGNVYITGLSGGIGTSSDYATIKYNALGIEQWAVRYNGPQNSTDESKSIAIDKSGNVYVTGNSAGDGTAMDYATIKYNSSGIEQWVSRYNGPTNSTDQSKSIAVDNSGNVYVTGYSQAGQNGYDITTIKYDSSGDSVWVEIFNTPEVGSSDFANSLVIDTLGNVYVSGWRYTSSSTTADNYLTIKYNSAGLQLWVADYNGPANSIDIPSSIAVDGNGNVYVTGNSQNSLVSGADNDYATVMYNSSGVQQWVSRYNGPANGQDESKSIAIDDSGNVYVTGQSTDVNGSTPDYATIKYNSLGVEQWVSRYTGIQNNSGDGAASLVLDNLGNVYVTGTSGSFSGTKADYATVKYNSLGVQQWAERYNGPPGNGIDQAKSIVLDNQGNVYVTGSSAGSGTSVDFATIKYSQTPTGINQTEYSLPEKYSLHQNYPNPFNPSTVIKYQLPISSQVIIKVYDVLGKEVATLVNEEKPAGRYQVNWNASNLSSGIYFYKIQSGSFVETKKMILLK
ncbi:MAG: SBBP repeat-containing protein [Ignavibacteriales bacterium]|nr:SBBP repeat-containing protein [Ignavibacteriales bacterium]